MDRIKQKKQRTDCVPAEEDENDDKLFMLSLVPKMRLLPTEENLNFRIEVQQLLLNKLRHSSQTNSSNEDSNYEEIVVKVETFGSADHLEGYQLDRVWSNVIVLWNFDAVRRKCIYNLTNESFCIKVCVCE